MDKKAKKSLKKKLILSLFAISCFMPALGVIASNIDPQYKEVLADGTPLQDQNPMVYVTPVDNKSIYECDDKQKTMHAVQKSNEEFVSFVFRLYNPKNEKLNDITIKYHTENFTAIEDIDFVGVNDNNLNQNTVKIPKGKDVSEIKKITVKTKSHGVKVDSMTISRMFYVVIDSAIESGEDGKTIEPIPISGTQGYDCGNIFSGVAKGKYYANKRLGCVIRTDYVYDTVPSRDSSIKDRGGLIIKEFDQYYAEGFGDHRSYSPTSNYDIPNNKERTFTEQGSKGYASTNDGIYADDGRYWWMRGESFHDREFATQGFDKIIATKMGHAYGSWNCAKYNTYEGNIKDAHSVDWYLGNEKFTKTSDGNNIDITDTGANKTLDKTGCNMDEWSIHLQIAINDVYKEHEDKSLWRFTQPTMCNAVEYVLGKRKADPVYYKSYSMNTKLTTLEANALKDASRIVDYGSQIKMVWGDTNWGEQGNTKIGWYKIPNCETKENLGLSIIMFGNSDLEGGCRMYGNMFFTFLDDMAPVIQNVYVDTKSMYADGIIRASVKFSEPVQNFKDTYLRAQTPTKDIDFYPVSTQHAGSDTVVYEFNTQNYGSEILTSLKFVSINHNTGSEGYDPKFEIRDFGQNGGNLINSSLPESVTNKNYAINYDKSKAGIELDGDVPVNPVTNANVGVKITKSASGRIYYKYVVSPTGTEEPEGVTDDWYEKPYHDQDNHVYASSVEYKLEEGQTYPTANLALPADSGRNGYYYLYIKVVSVNGTVAYFGEKPEDRDRGPGKPITRVLIDNEAPMIEVTPDSETFNPMQKKFNISVHETNILKDNYVYMYITHPTIKLGNKEPFIYPIEVSKESDGVYKGSKTITMQNILDAFYKYEDTQEYHIKENYAYFQIRFETTDMAENFTNSFTYNDVDYLDGQSIDVFLSTVPEFTAVVTEGAGNEQIKIELEKPEGETTKRYIPNLYKVGAEFIYANENTDVTNDMMLSVATGNSTKFETFYNEYGTEDSPYQIIKNADTKKCTVKFNQPGHYKVRLFQGSMYAGPFEYQITNNLADPTANYLKSTDPQLLPKNIVYKLSSEATRAVFNANGLISLLPYCAGAEAIFSDKARASAYIRYMEYEDLYAHILTGNEATMLNMGTGEGFHKAQGEPLANAGEVWIRYKSTAWIPGLNQQTAWVWYKTDFIIEEIAVSKLGSNITDVIDNVVQKTLAYGSTGYLIGDEYTHPKTGAPRLTAEQSNIAKAYTMTFTACGNKINAPSIGADNNLFANTLSVNYGGAPIDVPICSNVELSNNTTSLYVAKYNGGFDGLIYRQISYREGDTLKKALNSLDSVASSGVYSIVEVDNTGVNRFLVYIDNDSPSSKVTISTPQETDKTITTNPKDIVNFYATKFSIAGDTDSTEVDPYAYIAIYQGGRLYVEENTGRVAFFRSNEPTKFNLPDGSYDILIGDRSGNNYAFKVSIRNDEIQVDFKKSADESKLTITILNREIDEIVSYDVYLDDINVNNELVDPKVFYTTGIYGVYILDKYGIQTPLPEDEKFITYSFSRQEPDIAFSYFDKDGDWKRCSTDSEENVSLIIKDGLNGKIATTKYLLRVKYNPDLYTLVVHDTDPTAYTLDETNGYLTFVRKVNCSFTVTFKTDAKSYITYNIVIDEVAPSIVSSYTSEVYQAIDKTLDGYDVPLDMPNDLGYYTVIDPYTGKAETRTTIIANGDKVLADHVQIVISDATSLKEIVIYKDGAVILDELITNKGKYEMYLDGNDGYYQIVAYDVFGNVSTLSFTIDGESFGTATIDGQKVTSCGSDIAGRDFYYYGNTSATVTIPVGCKGVVIFEQNGFKYCYVLNPVAGELHLSKYNSTNDEGILDIVDNYDEIVITDKEYSPLEGINFKFILNEDGSVTVQFINGDIKTKLIVRVDKLEEIFDLYNFELSKEKTELVFLDPAGTILEPENGYIYCSSIARPVDADSDGKVTMVAYNPIQESFAPEDYVIYTGDYEFPGNGFYSFVCTNKYGNVSQYTVIANKDIVAVITEKFAEKDDEVHPLENGAYYYANGSISITGYRMATMDCEVGEITVDGEATVLTIKTPGTYLVTLIDINKNKAQFYVVIGSEAISYDESWLNGYNELAVLKDEGYTNQKLSIALDDNGLLTAGVYQIYYIYNGQKVVLYGWTSDGQYIPYNAERFAYCIGEDGNGVYDVYFANKYGDVCVKTIHYSTEETLSINKITTQSPEKIVVTIEQALLDGVYSNGSVILSSTLGTGAYIFKVKSGEGAYTDQNIGYPFEIPAASEHGEVYYTVLYIDAYGNCYEFNISLIRRDVNFDTSNVNSFVVDGVTYTKEYFSFAYDEVNYKITYTVNGGESQYYPSGLVISSDGKYQFYLVDKAGNQNIFGIIKDSVVEFRISVPDQEGNIENGFVSNSSVVVLTSGDLESAEIVSAKLNGVQINIINNTFTKSGFYELLVKDKIGNVRYFTFYLVGHELASFEYTATGDYIISNVYFINSEGIKVTAMGVVSEDFTHLDLTNAEIGTYQVSLKNKYDNSIKSFTIVINKDAPKASLVGCNSGETTTNEITLKDLEIGDEIDVYRDGKLIKTVTINDGTEFEKITEGGDYKLVVRSRKGTAVEYNFHKLVIANTPLSVLLIIVLLGGTVALLTGLILRSRSKSDD